MASNVKGPAIFLAQFAGDEAPFNSFDSICRWAAGHGYEGVQVPTWDARLIDLAKAASSKAYCDELAGVAASHGIAITELSTHLQGQLVAVNPAFDEAFDGFAPPQVGKLEGPAGVGGRPDAAGREGLAEPGARCLGVIHRRARMALRLSMAPAPGWPDRDRVRGTRNTLDADPECL